MHIVSQTPQSAPQVVQVSLPLQLPSPQRGAQTPQSSEQVEHVSLPLQVPSPQRGVATHAPQSAAQEEHVSVPLQVASPQRAMQVPQSAAHDEHVSIALQVPSPHRAVVHGPQVEYPEPVALQVCAPMRPPSAHTQVLVSFGAHAGVVDVPVPSPPHPIDTHPNTPIRIPTASPPFHPVDNVIVPALLARAAACGGRAEVTIYGARMQHLSGHYPPTIPSARAHEADELRAGRSLRT